MGTTDDLRRAVEGLPPGAGITLTREQLLEALPSSDADTTEAPDRLLTAREAAERLGVSPKYIYAHQKSFPFTRRLPGGNALRFSARGLERWLSRKR